MYDPMLKVFVEVADCGSFTKAAERLFISSTAIMKQMNLLEKQIGLLLFVRTPRGVHLTKAGESIYKDAKFMIQYSEESIERAYHAQATDRHIIRIGTSVLYPCKLLMDLWNQKADSQWEFKFKIIPFQDTKLFYYDLGKKYDLIAGVYDSTQMSELCRFLPLGQYHFSLAMSKKHRLAKLDHIGMADLYGEHLMIMKSGNSPVNDQIRSDIEKGHPLIILEDAPQYYDMDVFNSCEEKDYVLLTLDGWNDIHPSLITVPFDVDYTIPYGIMYSNHPNTDTLHFLAAVERSVLA